MNSTNEIEGRSIGDLPNIDKCQQCKSMDLIPLRNVVCEDVMTNKDVTRDIIKCNECECIHYLNSGRLSYEFIPDTIKHLNEFK